MNQASGLSPLVSAVPVLPATSTPAMAAALPVPELTVVSMASPTCWAVDVETAITLYTREAARMAGFEGLGMLKPGMKASFAVLDRDIFSIPADEIDRVQVLATYVRGTCVYQRGA